VRVGEAGGRSVVALVVALVALACALALPAVAAAESFEVNSTADQADAIPGNEFCLTAAGKCTLRAAIEEANSTEGEDRISFDRENVFTEQLDGTISLTSALPAIIHPIGIEGECVIENVLRPCVGVDGNGLPGAALTVEGTEAEIFGLAVTGAGVGLEVTGSPRLRVLSDWLGVKLDGSAGGNGTGMLLAEGSENVRIGNEGVNNVFANNAGDGLDIHGSSNVKVMSGYFGVGPDGGTLAPNGGKDIEVASLEGSAASRDRIGTQLTPEAAATPICDGGCNVISGSGTTGIDLQGDGGEEKPAESTTIIGNYIGLDMTGAVAIPNSGDDIDVGRADRTVIGGPRANEANRFAGGQTAVDAGPEAENLVVRGNSIGVGSTGADLAAPDDGVVVNSGELVNSEFRPNPAAEATIDGNELRMQGGIGIEQIGLGGWISGNSIAGADTGILASGETEEHGNLIQGNLIEGSALNGILLESAFNEVLGNGILGSGGAGILVEGAPFSFGVSSNLIGGDTEFDENLVSGSGGPAIEIVNPINTANEVGRNRGSANAGRFIALAKAAPAEKEGPNKGVRPPTISIATDSASGGFDAEAGARIRVFRKASAEAGEIESFLGEAIANEEGEWALAYDSPLPGGSIIAATQTAEAGTSELATATVPAAPVAETGSHGCPASGGCGFGPGAENPPNPQTKIFKGPKGKRFVGATAAFKFKASLAGSSFRCRLDGAPFRSCHSPAVYTGLKPGRHRFEVCAVNSAGAADPTPAKLKFTVLG
jgi:CSLREA domain-containing protein